MTLTVESPPQEGPEISPEMALALYASTAATAAIGTLRNHGLMNTSTIAELSQTLAVCAGMMGTQPPRLIEHIEKLQDRLQA